MKFHCAVCRKQFDNSKSLQGHINKVHRGNQNYINQHAFKDTMKFLFGFTEQEFTQLQKAKEDSGRNWHDFLLIMSSLYTTYKYSDKLAEFLKEEVKTNTEETT